MRKKQSVDLPETTVAERMFRLRTLAGLTQEELCDQISYTSNYYGQAERGAIPLSRKLAEKLRTFYNTTYEYLYYGIRADQVREESDYMYKNKMYQFLEGCTEEECDALYQISQVVIRSLRSGRNSTDGDC